MPGAVERMELRKVATEGDDDSTDSLDDPYSGPLDSEKVTINRSAQSLACTDDCEKVASHPLICCCRCSSSASALSNTLSSKFTALACSHTLRILSPPISQHRGEARLFTTTPVNCHNEKLA